MSSSLLIQGISAIDSALSSARALADPSANAAQVNALLDARSGLMRLRDRALAVEREARALDVLEEMLSELERNCARGDDKLPFAAMRGALRRLRGGVIPRGKEGG